MGEGTLAQVLAGEATWVVVEGDCLEVLPTIPDVSTVLVSDPPYGVNFSGKGTKHTPPSGVGYESTDDSPESLPLWEERIALALTKASHGCITPGRVNLRRYPDPRGVGSIFYPSGAGSYQWGFSCWQPVFYYGKDPFLCGGKGRRPDSFSTTEAAEENGHPCPKPIGTMLWLVERVSVSVSDVVLDPFCGSGTTGVACLRLGRRFIGIEKDARYAAIARERLRAESQGLSLRDARAGQLPMFGETP